MSLLYFIPGTMCTEQLWSRLWPMLEFDHQLVHLNISSAGNLADVVDDLVAQITATSEGRVFNLIGFSLGGYLASAVSLKLNSQLQRLMIVANTPMALPDAELIQRKRIIDTVKQHGYKGLNRTRVLSFLAKSQHRDQGLISLIQGMDQQFDERDLAHHLVTLSKRVDLCQALVDKGRLVWFCSGEADHLVNIKKAQVICQNTAHIELHQVADSGNFLPLEKPQQLAEVINKWLAKKSDDREGAISE